MLRFVQSAVRMSTRVVGQHSRVTSAAALTTTATRNFSLKHRDGWLEIEETGRGAYQNVVNDGRHVTLADEPGNIEGGLDSGMNPYGFLLAGLGACTSMTVRFASIFFFDRSIVRRHRCLLYLLFTRMYARKKDLPLDKVRVLLRHDRIWARDCNICQSEKGRVDVIDVDVQLIGDNLTDDDRAKLMHIANSCPVHQTLNRETVVKVNEIDEELNQIVQEHTAKAKKV
eukprot:m.87419 g.87419  ORF g.87419 m.87419 type:complete len:228 (-) comp12241_c1_seq1:307-990(-)